MKQKFVLTIQSEKHIHIFSSAEWLQMALNPHDCAYDYI
jgi:hypothetical protein